MPETNWNPGKVFLYGFIINAKYFVMQKKGVYLLVAAAALYGYYRYSKMTAEEKNALKEKGKKLLAEYFGLESLFHTKPAPADQ